MYLLIHSTNNYWVYYVPYIEISASIGVAWSFSLGTIAEVRKNLNARLASAGVLGDYKGGTPNPTSLCMSPEAREGIRIFGGLHMEYLDMVGMYKGRFLGNKK